jgi:hypothetical protein
MKTKKLKTRVEVGSISGRFIYILTQTYKKRLHKSLHNYN